MNKNKDGQIRGFIVFLHTDVALWIFSKYNNNNNNTKQKKWMQDRTDSNLELNGMDFQDSGDDMTSKF